MEKVELFSSIKELAHDRQSLYQGTCKDRVRLLNFFEMNEWFGQDIEYSPQNEILLFVTEKQACDLCKSVSLWLDGYRRENKEKLKILMQYGEKSLPQTVEFYKEFIAEKQYENDISAWRLLDFLLYHLYGEIMKIEPSEADNLVNKLDKEATRAVSEMYAEFNMWLQKKMRISGWQYKFEYRKKREDIGAYTVQQFSYMAYCLFNDEWWDKENLVEKACGSAVYANLWAFLAMHFVCGLRSTDIVRLPKPDIGMPGDVFREKVISGTLGLPESISQDIQIRIKYKPKRPKKTLSDTDIPNLKVFIPASLEKPIGIILGIAASHLPNIMIGDPFLHQDRSISRTRSFLGQDFMDIIGDKGFASSKANKAYLQGLEMMTDASQNRIKGYMIAALARSHKGGFGTLPNVTEIYLQDANFSGYKPEFIAKEMFERGIFGFVPHLLLEVYAGKEYIGLPVSEQTKLIKAIEIRPSGIEEIVRICEMSLVKAKEIVTEVISSKINIPDLIQEIASGRAVAKQDGCLCIMIGAGFACSYQDRVNCVGCRYEIHTKAILHQLASEYARMLALSEGPDGWRYRAMMRKTILPIIGEYLTCAKEMDPCADMNALSGIMKGALSGYDYSSK